MKQADLMREVQAVIEERLANNESAAMTWIVHDVMKRHQLPDCADRQFFELCGYEHVHSTVRTVLRSERSEESEPECATGELFPGFKRLQRRYTIPRAGEQVVVRVEQMTPDELVGKENELRAIGIGAIAHADEVRVYRLMRAAA